MYRQTAFECQPPTLIVNPRWERDQPYGPVERTILNQRSHQRAFREISSWPGYTLTPLHSLGGLAEQTGVGNIWLKDESARFASHGLGSFKALGAPYALLILLQDLIYTATGKHADSAELIGGRYGYVTREATAVCATDGNHGRALAWAARLFGCHCTVYVHDGVSEGRRCAIAAYGARVVNVPGTYDDAVRRASNDADRHGWLEVSDTACEGYTTVPKDAMQGYTVMVEEALTQMGNDLPTHVFVQCGVGGLATAVAAHLWERLGPRRPIVVVVEPAKAASLYSSLLDGRPTAVCGKLDTVMAGLACGVPSLLAWDILNEGASAFMCIEDSAAVATMCLLARGADGDPAIVSGESGVAGLAGFLEVVGDASARQALEMDENSRVLTFGSEGATDPELYAHYVGIPPELVVGTSNLKPKNGS